MAFYNVLLFVKYLLIGHCNGIASNNLDNAGNYPGTDIGIVFVLPGRRILDRKSGVSGRATSSVSVFYRAILYLNAANTSE